MSTTNGTAKGNPVVPEADGFNPVLLRLKQEAEDEVKRLRAELLGVRNDLIHTQDYHAKLLKLKESSLEEALAVALRRLEAELVAIRQYELSTPPTGARLSRAQRELVELLEAADRVLPEFTPKLADLTQAALGAYPPRSEQHRAFISRLGKEFLALAGPLREWIDKLSAVLEEGRLTEIQRLELLLRLTELEGKYQTADILLKQLGAV